MDKNAIKTFAVESRRKMIKSVKFQASLLGITADEIKEPISKAEGMETYDYGAGQHTIYDEDIKKRQSLVREINNKGFENVVEEVAYTWFNRIIAIRYMEVNDYLPERTRVLSSDIEGKLEPDIITEASDLDLDYSDDDREKIFKFKEESKLDELFQFLFIKQCNKLNEILPGLFEKTDDYMELLLNIKFTDENSVVRKLIDNISEESFEEIEIIGWIYQSYISELKDRLNNAIKSKKIQKNEIPAVTQLFTPDWIVKYMADNTLGRYWIERNENSKLKESLDFYIEEPLQNNEVQLACKELRSNSISVEDIKFFDPCMGSAHILVYAFDIFRKIYLELGFIDNEIPELIIKNNLYGLDIDKRAYQLAYFALLMKGRKYDRRLLKKDIKPNVYQIVDSQLSDETINIIKKFDLELGNNISYLRTVFKNAEEYGSMIKLDELNFDLIENRYEELLNIFNAKLYDSRIFNEIKNNLFSLIKQAKLLSIKYEVVVTNPPYMNKYDESLKRFTKKYYKDYSKDLFSIFIYRNFDFCKYGGYTAFMTPLVWMYLKSFEKLRKFLIKNKIFVSLIEMEYNTLWDIDAHVPACNFILGNYNFEKGYKGTFLKLSEFTGGLEIQKEKTLKAITKEVDYKYIKSNETFLKLPGNPIAYWVDDAIINSFSKYPSLEKISDLKSGRSTSGLNDQLFRYWFEVSLKDISFNSICLNDVETTFVPLNKGGSFRKWYGNRDYVSKVIFAKDDLDFKESITWSDINSSYFSSRYHEQGIISNNVGKRAYFDNEEELLYCLGFLNSNLSQYMLDMIIPTLHFDIGYVGKLPIVNYRKDDVIDLVKSNISICKEDWDDYELSWDFSKHPFLKKNISSMQKSSICFTEKKKENFKLLRNNEILLNKIFNEGYDVKNEIENNVEDKKISVVLADYEKDIKSFISYAVGCMFGRYSLDQEGLQFAGGEFNINNYSKFIPDDDNIIPVLDTEYFNDDIVGRFVEFVKVCFGEETLEENLDFIAGALKKKGKTSREIIRNYFLTDFFKDHAQTYKKTPIYWQFDSGKQNAFKCLIYMHRYEPGLVARVRTDYLHKTQKAIEQNLAQCESIIANSSNKAEVSKATKDKSKYIKQLDEIKVYDEALAHIANQRIEIDLDDGVKVNHAKFQNVEISKEGQKAKKINLLKKI